MSFQSVSLFQMIHEWSRTTVHYYLKGSFLTYFIDTDLITKTYNFIYLKSIF